MRNGRATVAATGLIALALLAGACSSDSSSGASSATTVATSDASWLFVQTASGGTWAAGADGSSGTLTLTGVSPEVQAFTDRPERQVSWQTPQEFVDGWSSYGFEQTAPNASVTLGSAQAGEPPVVLELAKPSWDAGSSTLTYEATVVDDSAQPASLPATFGSVSVFVDSGSEGTNLGSVQIWATLADDTDTVTIELDSGMTIGSFFQYGTITRYCDVVTTTQRTGSCTAAWQVNGSTLNLSGSRSNEGTAVPTPFVTTQAVTFGSVMVPGTTLTGTATLSPGATLTLIGPNNTPIEVTDGPFSVDVSFG